ncbi:MAG: prolipoprotein diacylglyceryl transferase family protein [Candidatus Gracilibacteria bacterium]|jgi:phosphatidylglycerol:prolipoprotein diacylglycerol transferase
MLQKFEIFGNIVSTYNIFLGIAFVVAVLVIERQMEVFSIKQEKRDKLRLLNAFVVICGIAGAALFEVIFQHKEITIDNLLTTGLTFYGGAIASLVLMIAYAFALRINIFFLLNFYAAPLAVAHAIGRIGCFFAGCCFGTITNSFFGVIFPTGSISDLHYHEAVKIHPVQLYESLSLFILFFILRKTSLEKRLGVYLIYYSIARFFLEFLRADSRGSIFPFFSLSPAQLISIPTFIVGILILVSPLYFPLTVSHKNPV